MAKSGRTLTLILMVALLVAVASASSVKAQGDGSAEMDRQLLSGLYLALGGTGWTNSDNWLDADELLDQWHGVDTDAQGRVTGLDLSGNGLTGAIPPGLSVLFDASALDLRLRELDFSDNGLSGEIPLGFAQLFPNLEVLRVANNQFRGPLPADLTSLTRLTELDLDNNHFSGQIPAWMGGFSGLTVLRLGGNDFDGPIPPGLGSLSKLSILGLGNNRLSGRIPVQIGDLKSLTRMSVFGNDLEGPLPSSLGKLSKLTKLSVGSNKLSGDVPADLGKLTNLEELWLGGNQFTGCLPDSLKRFANKPGSNLGGLLFCSESGDRAALVALYDSTGGDNWKNSANWNSSQPLGQWHGVTTDADGRVTRLNLSGNNLQGKLPEELGGLAGLEILHLSTNQLTGRIPAELGNLSKLKSLSLWNNQLSGEIPTELVGLSDLETLFLAVNQLTGETPAKLGELSKLAKLHLYENQLTGEIPAELGKLTELEHLSFYNNRLSGEIPAELGGLSKLELLHLSSNQLTGNIPAELGNLSSLSSLTIGGNQLTGCVPASLKGRLEASRSNLGGLSFCSDAAPPSFAQDWLLLGTAKRDSSGSVVLTPAGGGLGFFANPRQIDTQRFKVKFSFEIGPGLGADGLALIVSRTPIKNAGNAGGGFASNQFAEGAIAVEFDTYRNPADRGVAGHHVEISRLGGWNPARLSVKDVDEILRDGVFDAEVFFDGGRVQVYLANADLGMDRTLLLDHIIPDFTPYQGYLGFVGTTGIYTDRHVLHHVELEGADAVVPTPTPTPPSPTPEPTPKTPTPTPEAEDRAALVAIYNATGGENWKHKTNWNSDKPLDDWYGVATDSEGRVTELRLSSNQLRGEMPAELGSLGSLRGLDLKDNQLGNIAGLGHPGGSSLSSSIPPELGDLSNLTTLNLRDNQLSGEIPPELGRLDKLEWLYLSGNELSGNIPRELGDLSRLKLLHIHNNELSGTIPGKLGNLGRLNWLYISGNDLSGCVPGSLEARLKDGMGENVSNNFLGGLPFCSAAPLPPKEEGIRRDYDGLIALFNNTKGTEWDEIREKFSEEGSSCYFGEDRETPLNQWCGVTTNEDGRVIKLELGGIGAVDDQGWGIGLNGTIPGALGQMEELMVLDLSNGKVCGRLWGCNGGLSGEIPLELGHIPRRPERKLETLDLSGNELSGIVPSNLSQLPELTTLNLSHNALLGGASGLLEREYTGSDGSDELITIDLGNNPWNEEDDEHQEYWKEFKGEVTRGFIDLAELLANKKYPSTKIEDARSALTYLKDRTRKDVNKEVTARLVARSQAGGKWAKSALWLVRGSKLVAAAGSGVGWVVFTIEAAHILNDLIQAGVKVLEQGPGELIKDSQSKYLGTRDWCLYANNLHLGDPYSEEAIRVCGDNR